MAVLRLFVAAPIPLTVEKRAGEILEKASGNGEARWVSKTQLHITLRFIGNMEESVLSKLEDLLREAACGVLPFEVELGGFGAFPNLNRPTTFYIPVIKGMQGLSELEKEISSRLGSLGVKPEEKKFHPHLTLGRMREGRDSGKVTEGLQKVCQGPWPSWKVEQFILFKSQLSSTGPLYTKLKEFEIRKDKGVPDEEPTGA